MESVSENKEDIEYLNELEDSSFQEVTPLLHSYRPSPCLTHQLVLEIVESLENGMKVYEIAKEIPYSTRLFL